MTFSIPTRLPLLATAVLLTVSTCPAQTLSAAPAIVILPFAMAGSGMADASASTACSSGNAAIVEDVPAEDQTAVISILAAELQTKLVKDGKAATVGVPGAAIPSGATVLSGCITQMDAGNAKKRLVGAGMGASLLAAQVQVSHMVDGKPVVQKTFTEESRGRNFGVGSGMLINAMRAKRTSLQGDASNLADKIARTYIKHANAPAK